MCPRVHAKSLSNVRVRASARVDPRTQDDAALETGSVTSLRK